MSRGRKIKWVGLAFLAGAVGLAGWGWWGLRSRRLDDVAYQARLARWGGRSQDLPKYSGSLQWMRRNLGDELYFGLTGSDGRIVGNNRSGAIRSDTSKAELAELLEVQPIREALLAGAGQVDDDWVMGLRHPEAMLLLSVDGTSVADRSAPMIARMSALIDLGMVGTAVSDAAVDRIRRLPKLDHFYVGGPNIRAIRLVDPRVVDLQGAPAVRSGEVLRVEGKVEIRGLEGEPGNVRVMVRPEGFQPPWVSFPCGWDARIAGVGMLEPRSPGVYSFAVDVASIPPGSSEVQVWVDHRHAPGPKVVFYRLQPFQVMLAPPEPGRAGGPEPPGR